MSGLRFWTTVLGIAVLGGALWAIWTRDAGTPLPGAPPPAAREAPVTNSPPVPDSPSPPRPTDAPPAPMAPADDGSRAAGPPDGVDRDMVEGHLREAFAAKLPDHRLTDEEFEQLADTVLRIRAARQSLQKLRASPESAGEMERLREELTKAFTDFQTISNMTPGEFTQLAEPDLQPIQEGFTDDDIRPADESDVVHEYLHQFAPPD